MEVFLVSTQWSWTNALFRHTFGDFSRKKMYINMFHEALSGRRWIFLWVLLQPSYFCRLLFMNSYFLCVVFSLEKCKTFLIVWDSLNAHHEKNLPAALHFKTNYLKCHLFCRGAALSRESWWLWWPGVKFAVMCLVELAGVGWTLGCCNFVFSGVHNCLSFSVHQHISLFIAAELYPGEVLNGWHRAVVWKCGTSSSNKQPFTAREMKGEGGSKKTC